MKVLSLFDGMACGHVAFEEMNIPVKRYVAYEVDKYAIKTAIHNFPDIEEKGDVFAADFTEYAGFDAVIGGSPCTYWSIAQKNNRETEASGLGWELFRQYVRAVREVKPRFFLYENNKSMSKQIRASITETFGFEPILINSALVSAQNRQRLYWVGIRQPDGTYRKADIEQPKDRGILLRDVLGSANPVCMRYERTEEAKRCRKAYETGEMHHGFNELNELHPRTDGKTNTLSTVLKDNRICEPIELDDEYFKGGFGEEQKPNLMGKIICENTSRNGKQPAQGTRIYSINGKSICLDADSRKYVMCGKNGKQQPAYEVLNGQITIKEKQYPIKLVDGFYIIRKLTVSECKRLQTVPEWYEFPVSNTQSYKMLGNGWTVDVIVHLLKSVV